MSARPVETTVTEAIAPQHGAEVFVPLNRLKASPRNARKLPHSTAAIEALAASIKAKGVLQPPVVEVETDAEGVLIAVLAPHFASGKPADVIALVVTAIAATRLPLLPTVLIGVASAGLLRHLLP